VSVARIYTAQKSRKVWTCGKCGRELPVGSTVLSFTVGFRGREQKRCDQPDCYPKASERESSRVADVYAAIEGVDFSSASSLKDIQSGVQEVIDALEEVGNEYESNEMYDINQDLQDRANTLIDAASELSDWESGLEDEPQESDYESQIGEELTEEESRDMYEDDHDAWIETAAQAAMDAIEGITLP
jgi:hypothetical protein